jgi:hypothetical protein
MSVSPFRSAYDYRNCERLQWPSVSIFAWHAKALRRQPFLDFHIRNGDHGRDIIAVRRSDDLPMGICTAGSRELV